MSRPDDSGSPHTCVSRFVLATIALATVVGGSAHAQQQPDADEVVQLIVEQTNAFRSEHDLGKLETNETLTQTARDFADYMARTGKYGHNADGRTPAQRAQAHGYDYCLVLENIAYQFSTAGFTTEDLAERFMTGWKESEGHRENMLDADVTEIGVAIAQSEESDRYYAVQMFGRPKSASINFSIANPTQEAVRYTVGEESFALPPRATRRHTICRPESVQLVETTNGETQPIGDAVSVEDGASYTVALQEGEPVIRQSDGGGGSE